MLLRKLSTHIKEQNWSTVLVEFLIVVFGPFMGLQSNGWQAGSTGDNEASS